MAAVEELGILIVCFMIFMSVLAIIGMQLYMGKFSQCSDPAFPPATSRWGVLDPNNSSRWIVEPCTEEFGRTWEPKEPFNFDNIGNAMIATFTFTAGGWGGSMFSAIDSTGFELQPMKNHSYAHVAFFLAAVFFMGNYFVGLFVGIVFQTYIKVKASMRTGMLLSDEERRWFDFQDHLMSIRPTPLVENKELTGFLACFQCCSRWHGQSWCIKKLREDVVESKTFPRFVQFFLILNFLIIAMITSDPPRWVVRFQDIGNVIIAVAFGIEMLLKITAYGPFALLIHHRQRYIHIFDLVITISAYLEYISSCKSAQMIRALRVARLLRWVGFIPGAGPFLAAVETAVPGTINIALIFGSMIFNFSFIGHSWFGTRDDVEAEPDRPYANFSTLGASMQLLFVVATGDRWEDLLDALNADPGMSYGDRALANIFIIVYVAVTQFLMMNLFVMIIVETYELLDDETRAEAGQQIPVFKEGWMKLDPEATGFLKPRIQTLTVTNPDDFGVVLFDEEPEGLIALTITDGSEAANAGIVEFTTILRVNGKDVFTEHDLLAALHKGAQVEFVADPLTELISILPPPIGVGNSSRRMEVQQMVKFVRVYHDHKHKEAAVSFTKTLIALIAWMSNVKVKAAEFQESVARGRALTVVRRAVRRWKAKRDKLTSDRHGFTHKMGS